MEYIQHAISWYQNKIGAHDKQSWERKYEEKVLNTFDDIPKREATFKGQMIDVDLIKGSTFTKAKPEKRWSGRTWFGLLRLLFMPVFARWWAKHTSGWFLALSLTLYFLQGLSIFVYFKYPESFSDSFSGIDLLSPCVYMVILSVIHTQIVLTQSTCHDHSATKCSKRHNRRQQDKVRPTANFASEAPFTSRSKTTGDTNEYSGYNHVVRNLPPKSEGLLNSQIINCSAQINGSAERNNSVKNDVPQNIISHELSNGDLIQQKISSSGRDCAQVSSIISHGPISQPTSLCMAKSGISASTLRKRKVSSSLQNSPHSLEPNRPFVSPVTLNGTETFIKGPTLDSLSTGNGSPERLGPGILNGDSEDLSKMDHQPLPKKYNSELNCESDQEMRCSEFDSSDTGSDLSDSQESDAPYDSCQSMAYFPSFNDKIACFVWEGRACKKADLSVMDIGAEIERRVRTMQFDREYIILAITLTVFLAFAPFCFRAHNSQDVFTVAALVWRHTNWDCISEIVRTCSINITASAVHGVLQPVFLEIVGHTWPEKLTSFNAVLQRLTLVGTLFFLLVTAEYTFVQRLQYAKHFSYLTSAHKSKKYGVPHFRLSKAKHIKVWLSLRSYLKKRSPQRSVDVIITSTFILLVAILTLTCGQLLNRHETFFDIFLNWELTIICVGLGLLLLRLNSLGDKTNKMYRNVSILLTEQINLYLQMEHRPHKKEELFEDKYSFKAGTRFTQGIVQTF